MCAGGKTVLNDKLPAGTYTLVVAGFGPPGGRYRTEGRYNITMTCVPESGGTEPQPIACGQAYTGNTMAGAQHNATLPAGGAAAVSMREVMFDFSVDSTADPGVQYVFNVCDSDFETFLT